MKFKKWLVTSPVQWLDISVLSPDPQTQAV